MSSDDHKNIAVYVSRDTTKIRQDNDRPSELGIGCFLLSHSPRVLTMASSQQPKGRDGVLSALDVLIQALNVAKDACGIPPAQIALGSASALLTMIRVPPPCSAMMIFRLTLSRTRWPTIRITLSWDGLAPVYAKRSTGD
jgi:hypothetical protein